ncbi:MAG: acyl-CoA dehydrogenase family protein [Deltaproteobacteria bacterium]|nr:acyl-CoA dehydrogenase family protein [Deltaproteobacteria bacterium]
MDFQLSDEQKLLRDSVRTFTKQRSPIARFRKLRDRVAAEGGSWDAAVWREMGELGWLSLPFPEQIGGYGGSFVDVAILLEAFGATLVPEPYLASVVLAGTALLHAGDLAQQQRWLAPMIEGRHSLALAHGERATRFDALPQTTMATVEGDGFRVRGHKQFVANGDRADLLLVSALHDGRAQLFAVPRDHEGVTVTPVRTIDGLGAANVTIDARLSAAHRLGQDAGVALERAHDAAAAMAVAEGLGVCQAVLDMTVEQLRTREQFGVPIGSFQALQHRAVEMFVEVQLIKSVSVLASVRAADDDDAERRRAVSAAKAQLAMSGRFVTQQAIQLHGGIGITDEHDVGLYFKRMHVLGLLCGDEEHHVRRFAAQPQFTAGLG